MTNLPVCTHNCATQYGEDDGEKKSSTEFQATTTMDYLENTGNEHDWY